MMEGAGDGYTSHLLVGPGKPRLSGEVNRTREKPSYEREERQGIRKKQRRKTFESTYSAKNLEPISTTQLEKLPSRSKELQKGTSTPQSLKGGGMKSHAVKKPFHGTTSGTTWCTEGELNR